jgi:hypothetical protein
MVAIEDADGRKKQLSVFHIALDVGKADYSASA